MNTLIDGHVHVWQAGSLQTAWLEKAPYCDDPGWAPLRGTFLAEDYQALLRAEQLAGAVLVEAADSLQETEALIELARRHDWVKGVVGWLPLADRARFAAAMVQYDEVSALVGVRHMIHDEADPNWVIQEPVVDSICDLGRAGLSYDFVGVTLDHLENLARLADACPATWIVLDHLNNPPIADGIFEPWATALAKAAARPNVVAKVSGLEMCSRWGDWGLIDWQPYLDHALEVFGANRVMLGSNWPVSTMSGSFAEIWNTHRCWLARLSSNEQVAIGWKTAYRVYGRGRLEALPRSYR